MVEGLPAIYENYQETSENEVSTLKESLTTSEIEKMNENESSIHERILTIYHEPPDIKVSRAHMSPDTEVSRGHISPGVEVSRAHESPFVSDPVSAHRDLVTGVAPSTAPPIAGDICAFPKSPEISFSRDSESFVGTSVSVLEDLGTRVTPSIALPHVVTIVLLTKFPHRGDRAKKWHV